MPDYILVLDLGSSSLKAVLLARDGSVAAQAGAAYPTASPRPGWFEQSPDDWAEAAASAIARLGDLSGVAMLAPTGTMQNVIPLDEAGRPLCPAILYSDARATVRFPAFVAAMAEIDAAERLGNRIDPLMCSAKLEWLRAEAPDTFAAAMFHAGAKDFLSFLLTGRHATDPSAASTTGLMDLSRRQWDAQILQSLALRETQLPRILPAGAIVGHVTQAAAARFGLPHGIPVLNGCGDAGAATLGAGLTHAREAYVYLGTTGWVARNALATFPRVPLAIYTLAHPAPGLLIEIAPILSAGDAVAWSTELLGDAPAPDDGTELPLFLPYLKGERSPFHDSGVRGAFLGLDRAHGPSHLRRAVLEGVALAIRHNLAELGGAEGVVPAIGGGAANTQWLQILADTIGHTIAAPQMPVAATALGVGKLAAQVLGWPETPPLPPTLLHPRANADRRFARYLAASDFLRAFARIPLAS
jgi:xylulokinase